MNSIPRQLATFAAVLAGLYTVGFIAGQFIDAEPHGGDDMTHEQQKTSMTSNGHQGGGHGAAAQPDRVRGLAVADNGLQLELADAELERGRSEELRLPHRRRARRGRPRLRRRT